MSNLAYLKNVILRLFIYVLKSSIFTKLIFTKKDKKRQKKSNYCLNISYFERFYLKKRAKSVFLGC